MRHFGIVFTLLVTVLPCLNTEAQEPPHHLQTLKDKIEQTEKAYGISFIYDSSINLNTVYVGGRTGGMELDAALDKIFHKTGIEWKYKGKYIVLTEGPTVEVSDSIAQAEQERRDTIVESIVSSNRIHRRNTTQTGLTRLDGNRLNRGFAFMSSPDVIKTLQQLPGVVTGTELMSGLYVHGGTGSDNLFLLDGVPLYQVSHLGGMFSSFNTDIISSLDFYKSGFPARYGGRLSSVVDVRTMDGNFDDYRGVFSIGLIDSRIQFGGPIVRGKTSFNISARRSWLDIITTPVMAIMNASKKSDNLKKGFGYAFWDLNGKISHLISDQSKLSLNLYYGRDAMKMKSRTEQNNESSLGWDTSFIHTGWGNVLASLNWEKQIDNGLNISMSTYYTKYDSKIGIDEKYGTNDGSQYEEYDEKLTSNIQDVGYRADIDWKISRVNHLRFGLTYQYHYYSPNYRMFEKSDLSGTEIMRNEHIERVRYMGQEPALYLEDELNITKWFNADVGLRYVIFAVPGKVRHALEPRAALNFNFSESVQFKMSYAEMNQFCHQVTTVNMDLPTYFWAPSTTKIAPMHSRQVAAGIYLDFPHDIRLNVEGFYKTMNHLREYGSRKTLFPELTSWEHTLSEGVGKAYGVELETGWKNDRLDIVAYYTLSWSKRKFDDFCRDWFYDKNDSRHKFTINATYRFSDKIDAYAAWNYSTGTKFTIPTHHTDYESLHSGHHLGYNGDYLIYSKPNNAKLPDYHRLDIGINFRKTTKRGLEQIWNLSIYNVYCRMNAVTGYISDEVNKEGKRIFVGRAEGMIPIIPSFSYTIKF